MKGVTSPSRCLSPAVPSFARPALFFLLIGAHVSFLPHPSFQRHGRHPVRTAFCFDLPGSRPGWLWEYRRTRRYRSLRVLARLVPHPHYSGHLFGSLTGQRWPVLGHDLAIDPLIYTLVAWGGCRRHRPVPLLRMNHDSARDNRRLTRLSVFMFWVVTAAYIGCHWFAIFFWRPGACPLRGCLIRSPERCGVGQRVVAGRPDEAPRILP